MALLVAFKIEDYIDIWGYKLLISYGMTTNLTLVIFKVLVVMLMLLGETFKEISQNQDVPNQFSLDMEKLRVMRRTSSTIHKNKEYSFVAMLYSRKWAFY